MATKTVLIVDDLDLVRNILSSFVKIEGHRAVEAARGEEALQIIRKGEVNLVILDVMMPDIDGITVLRKVRKRWTRRELPVVVVSALDEEVILAGAIEAGANECLAKPFTQGDVRSILRRYLAVPERQAITDEDFASYSL